MRVIGIRLKISLGFAVLTVVVISAVSFWAAQSLGVTLDSSDIERLEILKRKVEIKLEHQQQQLSRLASETVQVLGPLNFFSVPLAEQQRLAEKLKSSLNVSWLEIFIDDSPLLFSQSSGKKPEIINNRPIRLTISGPFSYQGYMAAEAEVVGMPSAKLILAEKPDLSETDIPLFCIFDEKEKLAASHNLDHQVLMKLFIDNRTDQMLLGDTLFRVRCFADKASNLLIATGYPSQMAVISRSSLDQLMFRIAILEVIGLLILGFFLGRKLLLPLNALQHAIEQVAAGHWKEIPLTEPPMQGSGDEIETVARSFNHMVRELSLAQTRLIEVQKELSQKDKMAALGRFSAGIAHEINNPLGTILVTAGMLKEASGKGITIQAEEFDEIIEEVKRCRDIIATLRTFTSKLHPNLSIISAIDFFNNLMDYVQSATQFQGLEIEFDLTGNPDCHLNIDFKAMQRVFENMLKNSQDAVSQQSNKKIKILFEVSDKFLAIKIQDWGKGFECLPEQIFEPLVTSKAQGTGLGLVICQAIVEGHNGKIEASRVEEKGMTEFRIFLPLVSENQT